MYKIAENTIDINNMMMIDPIVPIRPQGFDIAQVREVLGQTVLKDLTLFINNSDNVLELIDAFVQLIGREEIEFGAKPLAGLQVAGMMIFMLHHDDLESTQAERTHFMQRCFDYLACTEETHVHELCKEILGLLNINDSQHMLNMINCCRVASPLSTMAQIVCTCLLWAMLDNLTDLGFETYRLRAYSDIMMAISMVNPLVYLQEYLHSLNLVVRVIGTMLIVGPYGNTEKLRLEIGVPQHMLDFPEADASVLFRWLSTISDELRDELQVQDGRGPERMVILETSCELMKHVHAHLSAFYQRVYAEYDDDGFVSDQHFEDDDYDWLL